MVTRACSPYQRLTKKCRLSIFQPAASIQHKWGERPVWTTASHSSKQKQMLGSNFSVQVKRTCVMARLSLRVHLDVGSSWASGTPTPQWETSWVRSSQEFTSLRLGECLSLFLDSSLPPLASSASSSWLKVRKIQRFWSKSSLICKCFVSFLTW